LIEVEGDEPEYQGQPHNDDIDVNVILRRSNLTNNECSSDMESHELDVDM
jgi:hypothetical protein